MNLVRVGTCTVVGMAEGVAGFNVKPFKSPLSGQPYLWNVPVALVALLMGALIDAVNPDVSPDMVGGLIDAGATTTASWLTSEMLHLANVPVGSIPSPVFPYVASGARGALGGFPGAPKVELV